MYKHFFKRLLDILISGIALLLIGWFLILVTIFLHFADRVLPYPSANHTSLLITKIL